MSDRRQSLATATVGAAGVGGAAALRHEALVRAYEERSKTPIARPKALGELRMVKHPKGRKVWLAGAGLGAASLPAFATGVHGTLHPTGRSRAAKRDSDRRSFLREGLSGAKAAVVDRTDSVREKPPAKLVAGNYAAGVGVGSVAGGLTHLALRKAPVNLHAKSALAALAGGAAGTAALPVQSRLTRRYSHGAYQVTPTGVRRAKTAPKRASSKATVIDSRHGNPAAFRAQTVGKGLPRGKSGKPILGAGLFRIRSYAEEARLKEITERSRKAREESWRKRTGGIEKMSPRTMVRTARRGYNDVGARVGAHWTVQGLRAADLVDVPNRTALPRTRKGKLVYTGRTKAANVIRSAALDVGSINDKDAMARQAIHGHPLIGKREDPGASMSRGERRARIAAAGPPIPVVGDIIQARTAGKLSPKRYERRTQVQAFGAGQAGGFAGNAAGAGLALGAARLSPGFDRRAKAANDKVDAFKDAIKDRAYSTVGRERGRGPGLATRALTHRRTPEAVRRGAAAVVGSPVGRAVARNPKVAAIGALVGGSVGAPTAQQAMLSHTMTRDDRYRRRYAKRDTTTPIPLTHRESTQLRRRKEAAAVASQFTGATGIAALGATLGASALKRGRLKELHWAKPARKKLQHSTVPLVVAGSGVGGLNSFNYANIQHQEARQIRKALGVPRLVAVRRAPSMRRGFVRQTRYPSGMVRTTTVRGGLA